MPPACPVSLLLLVGEWELKQPSKPPKDTFCCGAHLRELLVDRSWASTPSPRLGWGRLAGLPPSSSWRHIPAHHVAVHLGHPPDLEGHGGRRGAGGAAAPPEARGYLLEQPG